MKPTRHGWMKNFCIHGKRDYTKPRQSCIDETTA
jgi:hypothetical protein